MATLTFYSTEKTGVLSDLTTTDKDMLVDAINEVDANAEQNLIHTPYDNTSGSSRGLTFTANSDGSLSYTGTPNSSSAPAFALLSGVALPKGRYTIKGGSDLYAGVCVLLYDDSDCTTSYTGTASGLYSTTNYVYTTADGGKATSTNLHGYNREITIESDAYAVIQCRAVNNTITSAISGTIYPRLERGIYA